MRIILFLTFFAGFSNLFSQNVIELKNKETGKVRILKQGTKLHFKAKGDSLYVKGKISQIKDTSIVIYCPDYEDAMPLVDVSLSNLIAIKKPTGIHGTAKGAGMVLMPGGAILFLGGITGLIRGDDSFHGQSSNDSDLYKAYTFSGLGLFAAGLLPYIIKSKEYDLKNEWTISIKKD
jgi:hypothetical protein